MTKKTINRLETQFEVSKYLNYFILHEKCIFLKLIIAKY